MFRSIELDDINVSNNVSSEGVAGCDSILAAFFLFGSSPEFVGKKWYSIEFVEELEGQRIRTKYVFNHG